MLWKRGLLQLFKHLFREGKQFINKVRVKLMSCLIRIIYVVLFLKALKAFQSESSLVLFHLCSDCVRNLLIDLISCVN